jgi:glucosamine--fructose-6-phosphate aminotransferase (isomerizing)
MSELGALMEAEMAEQPKRLHALFSRREEIATQVASLVPSPLAGTIFVARGSSDHAATCGRYLLEMATGRPAASASPSVATLYKARTDFSGYLVIAASQSGRTPEIVEVTERARAAGAATVAVTNDAASPLAGAAELLVALEAGEERAVPATKTVTAELGAFAIIAWALGLGEGSAHSLGRELLRGGPLGLTAGAFERLPGQVAEVLADSGPPEALAAWLASSPGLIVVARGILYGAACEVALKVEETTSRLTAAFSANDFRHGPIAIARAGTPVLALNHPGPASADVARLVAEMSSRGASVKVAGPLEGAEATWPAAVPEPLAPVLAVVRGQQLALALARLLALDPDAPAGLAKVTVT